MSYRLSVLHSFDPLGAKVGGLETFVRDILGNLPDDFTFLMVGVDLRESVSSDASRAKLFAARPSIFFRSCTIRKTRRAKLPSA